MARKIYLLEDEKSLNILLKKYLEIEGYEVTTFDNGLSAFEKINDLPDLWILDIMVPGMDGYELIKSIKSYNPTTPVIFISARNEELDRVVGLELGSDDYLSKPFLPRELVLRTNRLIKMMYHSESSAEPKTKTIEGYIIDELQKIVIHNGEEIALSKKEFELLNYMVNNKNIVLSREQILSNVWGEDYFGTDRVVDDTFRRLRKKLEDLKIETVYGFGYKLLDK